MLENKQDYDNFSIVKQLRKDNDCLFKNIVFPCESQGKCKTDENHLIQRASYLRRISCERQVLVFDFENRDYVKKNKRELVKRNIKSANAFHVLCGKHDTYLFDEIENGKDFDENNQKQLFQFALRAFVFSLAESRIKDNFNGIMRDSITNTIAKENLRNNNERLQEYQRLLQNQEWDGVVTRVIVLNRESHFISCMYKKPDYGIMLPIRFVRGYVSYNIFPDKDKKTIVLLSYLKTDMAAKGLEKYCERMVRLAERHEERFVVYINKLVVAFDHNIAVGPYFWNDLSKEEKEKFYKVAHIFPKCKTLFSGCIGYVKLKLMRDVTSLIK